MFEHLPASETSKRSQTLAYKFLAGGAVSVVLGFGLCSAALGLNQSGNRFLVVLVLILFAGGGIVVILSFIWCLVELVIYFAKKRSAATKKHIS